MEEFCKVCSKCADNCPANAISGGKRSEEPLNASNADGTLKWYMDGEKCFGFWAQNTCDCANCIRVCPFNKPEGRLHDMSRKVIETSPMFDRLFVKADDLFGYGKKNDAATYWDA